MPQWTVLYIPFHGHMYASISDIYPRVESLGYMINNNKYTIFNVVIVISSPTWDKILSISLNFYHNLVLSIV